MSSKDLAESVALIERLTAGVQATSSLVQSLSAEIRGNSVALGGFNADLKNLRETVNGLAHILRDGNGESLMTRMSLIEAAAHRIETDLKEISERLKTVEDRQERDILDIETRKVKGEDSGRRLQFWGTVIPAVLALIGSIVAIFMK